MQRELLSCPIFDEVVYLFQGGGALGAFQVGVYQALNESGYAPNWMVGISIGALNAAIIAGNPPEKRMQQMYHFWDMITHGIEPFLYAHDDQYVSYIQAYNMCSAMQALHFGQKNFFNTAGINPWLNNDTTPDKISYYSTEPLVNTLQQLIDFEYLNAAHVRLSLGAVNIETGKLCFFDNTKQALTVDHIRASCALPPGFPAVKIDGQYYWDGGLYSNTPLITVINDAPDKRRMCFLVDLFDSTGTLPSNMDEVLERAKDINYSGHMDILIELLNKLDIKHNLIIAKIVYTAHKNELHSKDYEFSNFTARRRLVEGYTRTKKLIADPEWWKNLGVTHG